MSVFTTWYSSHHIVALVIFLGAMGVGGVGYLLWRDIFPDDIPGWTILGYVPPPNIRLPADRTVVAQGVDESTGERGT